MKLFFRKHAGNGSIFRRTDSPSSLKRTVLSVALGAVVAAGGILLLAGFSTSGEDKLASAASTATNPVLVETVEVESAKLLQDLSSFGTVSFSRKNDVTVQVQGVLKKLLVKEGDRVSVGQPVAYLENIQLELQRQQEETAVNSARAGVELARTRLREGRLTAEGGLLELEKLELQLTHQQLELAEARLELERQSQLLELGGVTPAAYRSLEVELEGMEAALDIAQKEYQARSLGFRREDLVAQGMEPAEDDEVLHRQLVELNTRTLAAELAAAEAVLESAENSLRSVNELRSHLVVRSTMSGVVAVKNFEEGEFLSANETLLSVIQVDQVHAVFSIQEQDIGLFSLGLPVAVEIPALDVTLDSPVTEISPVADPQSGNFTLKSSLENGDDKIKPGMFVKCLIPRESPRYPTVPETALLSSVSGDREDKEKRGEVFVVHEGRAIRRSVQIEATADGQVWISEGLEEGSRVIDHPSPFLKEGQPVAFEGGVAG